MESTQYDDEPDVARGARTALADAQAAREEVVRGIHYPPSYRPLMAFSGAGLPLLMTAGSGDAPGPLAEGVMVAVGFLAVVASGWAFHVFESANGVRITGLRSGSRISLTYVVAMFTVLAIVTVVSRVTGAWWAALVASPIGAAITVAYVNAWLAAFRREA